jgi:hypothetical protein
MPLPMVGHATSMSAAVDIVVETVIKAVLVLDGMELCTVGFLPRHVAARPQKAAHLNNKFAHIIELILLQQLKLN